MGAGFKDAFIAKFDVDYNSVKNITWGGVADDYGKSITLDDSGNIYITGSTKDTLVSDRDAFIAKHNSAGTSTLNITWGGSSSDDGYGIAVDSSGNMYITGSTSSYGAGNNDVFIAKYDDSGFLLWNDVWGGGYHDGGLDIAIDTLESIYITGFVRDSGPSDVNAFILKYSFLSQGSPPIGLIDILTSPIGLITVLCFLGAGLILGILLGRRKWDVDTTSIQNKKTSKLEK
jgi:hypothetical protein